MELWIKDRACINVLGGSIENAKDVYEAADGHVLVGVLTANYDSVDAAIADMQKYNEVLNGNLSVGLGNGNPAQQYDVARVAKAVKCKHYNQAFTYVSATRANNGTNDAIVNAMCTLTGTPGIIRISTGPISSKSEKGADVPVDTAIDMIRDMGGSSIKFFPMHGLKYRDEVVAVAEACGRKGLWFEPTGGIDLNNFREIVQICLQQNVEKFIPHVYSSIIDKSTGNTRTDDVKALIKILKEELA
jgi:uncharacterized protein (TIGR03581 family)